MITHLRRVGSILLAFGLMAASASAQNSSIRGDVKGMDGKPLAGAQVKVERTDAKARAVNINSDANGNYIANGLSVGTFRVTAYGKTNAKEIGGITTKSGSSVTVDLNLSTKSNNKLEKHYVRVKSENGSEIGGRWEEDNQASSPGMNSKAKTTGQPASQPSRAYGGMGH
jgi:hypothetical protein